MKNLCKYFILLYFMIVSKLVYADLINQQRQNYEQIKKAFDKHNIPIVIKLLPKLKKYPLYPDLEYELLIQKIKRNTNALLIKHSVSKFIKKYYDLPLSRMLNNHFINLLAQQKNWKTLSVFTSKPPRQIQAFCNWYYAKWYTNHKSINFHNSTKILLKHISLPSDCNKLLFITKKYSKTFPSIIIEKIRLAMKANNQKSINFLINILPSDYKMISNLILEFKRHPLSIMDYIKKAPPSNFSLQSINYALLHLSHKNMLLAKKILPTILNIYKLKTTDIQLIKEILASNMMHEHINSELKTWRDSVIMHSKSASLIERRVRLSLISKDNYGLKFWISRLPKIVKNKEEWQYWLANIYYFQRNNKKGDDILHKLIKRNSFYSLVSAQKLGLSYLFKHDISPSPDHTISNLKEIIRIRELMHWKKYDLARIEWHNLISNKKHTIKQKKMLARYANEQKWWYFSVQATIQAKIWNNIKERFPLGWNDLYKKYTNNKYITKNYAMAITRQESSWDPKAYSLMNAIGLMQIEPNTMKEIIKIYNIKNIYNRNILFDPETNIWMGTNYLEYIFKQLGNNRILAAAAYNAGLSNINKWKRRSAGRIDAIAFIEAIPFIETRQYVKNILLYNAYYNYLTGKPENILTSLEWNHRY
ncbi:murein transglycosylase [Candidatus Pantoea edessiphila]|uniref:Murein transglycosylase n=1 Tax=Candidatus Pantoea edessiphila TaxID=2044610 RepID=A0A2P5SW76_9GAMM|nr:murein transglycosylase [Candidatus Pantoea edessiphila]PPI86572.1 murein transglycosylase [Candidatus Pantoea edessiphila]